MSELTTVARPYAKAAFDFAVEQNDIESWQQMLSFAAQVSRNNEMTNLLTADIKSDALAQLFISVCGDVLNQYGQNFIKVMAENRRLSLLPQVLELFMHFCAQKDATIDVEVVSASELTQTQQDKIATAVEKRLSRKVKLNCKIDPSVISGFVIRAGDMVIDSTIKGRLERLTDALQS